MNGIVSRLFIGVAAALMLFATAPVGAQDMPEPDPDAQKAFAAVRAAYLKRPGLEIKSSLEIELQQGDQVAQSEKIEAAFTYAKDGPGIVKLKGYTCRFADGDFVAIHEATDGSYFREEYEGSPYWTFLIGFQDLPYPLLAMLWGEPELGDVYMQLHPQSPWIAPKSVEDVEIEKDGEVVKRQKIVLASDDARMEMLVDPKTRLIDSIAHEITGGDFVQAGATKTTRYTYVYETYDEPIPAAELALDLGERERVDLLAALQPPPARAAAPGGAMPGGAMPGGTLVGRPAPQFVLATANGGAIDLADLEGKVVVLDFWATWCGPCRRALPMLHDVARWAREEALPVEIITVNVWEATNPAQDDPDKRLESVKAFWTRNNYTLPVAMDYTDETARSYGVRGIPATFVLRADLVVHGQPHADAELLKQTILDAIAALEAPAEGDAEAAP
jgi:thiol-disulfide isomerase/thioredoxin